MGTVTVSFATLMSQTGYWGDGTRRATELTSWKGGWKRTLQMLKAKLLRQQLVQGSVQLGFHRLAGSGFEALQHGVVRMLPVLCVLLGLQQLWI